MTSQLKIKAYVLAIFGRKQQTWTNNCKDIHLYLILYILSQVANNIRVGLHKHLAAILAGDSRHIVFAQRLLTRILIRVFECINDKGRGIFAGKFQYQWVGIEW